jgi:hypothetical protein
MEGTIKVSFTIGLDLLKSLEELSEDTGKSLEQLAVEALTDYVELYEDTGAESLSDHLEPYETAEEIDEDGQIIRVFPEDDGC